MFLLNLKKVHGWKKACLKFQGRSDGCFVNCPVPLMNILVYYVLWNLTKNHCRVLFVPIPFPFWSRLQTRLWSCIYVGIKYSQRPCIIREFNIPMNLVQSNWTLIGKKWIPVVLSKNRKITKINILAEVCVLKYLIYWWYPFSADAIKYSM